MEYQNEQNIIIRRTPKSVYAGFDNLFRRQVSDYVNCNRLLSDIEAC